MSKGLERGLFNNYIANNLRRVSPLPFELTLEQFTEIIKQNCYICGSEPSQIYYKQKKYGHIIYNGIDRVDNTKGYTISNSKACCKVCNSVKSAHSLVDLKTHLKRMLEGLSDENPKTVSNTESFWPPHIRLQTRKPIKK